MESQVWLSPEVTMVRPPVIHPQSLQNRPEQQSALMQVTDIQATAMEPIQSVSFAEIFLNAVIASVLYTRELIKHDSPIFSDRCVADLLDRSGPVNYTKLLQLKAQGGHGNSQVFKILLHGKSQRAEKILTLLVRIYSVSQSRN